MDSDDDLLSELLAPLRLHGVFYSHWSMRAPWGVAGEREHCAIMHYVTEGECVMELPEVADPVLLRAGDLAVFPHGSGHRLADRPGRPAVPLAELLPAREPGTMRAMQIDGSGSATTMLCGGLHYNDAAAAPLYRALPSVFVLDKAMVDSQPLLAQMLHRLPGEGSDGGAGVRLVVLRVFELVFVLALRAAISELATGEPVLRALHHPAISRALLAIHSRFAQPWKLESLAAEAGLSRSAFASTFRALVGEPPMRHLTGRRMQEAARLLAETTLAHNRIAERVGYRSTVGFHLAFRSWLGQTPGEYRHSCASAVKSAQHEESGAAAIG
ncbi:AraC family transcriptional regulator [Nonomuraea jabiensis]|uniref:AraC family transcriptional regulator n=1 Tax=Nonomuraea jabiensis TaxID=882448 RepID=UPI003D70A870